MKPCSDQGHNVEPNTLLCNCGKFTVEELIARSRQSVFGKPVPKLEDVANGTEKLAEPLRKVVPKLTKAPLVKTGRKSLRRPR